MNSQLHESKTRLKGSPIRAVLQRLREPADLHTLQNLRNTTLFLEEMFLLLGRNLAVAATWLPEPTRHEGIVAFLACRVLDAHEDLHADSKQAACAIADACAFLTGQAASPPATPTSNVHRESDQLEALLATRIHDVRAALLALPNTSRMRIETLLQSIATAMAKHRLELAVNADADASEYGRHVLGRVVEYSLQLLGLQLPDTEDFLQLGHALQNLNHIRDLAADMEHSTHQQDGPAKLLRLLLELVEASATASHALGTLTFPVISGERAALTYMVATSLASIYKQVGVQPTWLAGNSLLCARLAYLSPFFFNQLRQEIDNTLLQLIVVLLHRETGNTFTPTVNHSASSVLSAPQEKFELSIADQHPNPATAARLKRYVRLNRFSLAILNNLPDVQISGLPRNHVEGRKIMISDYFLASAVGVMCEVGAKELALFSRTCADLIEDLESGHGIDAYGRTAAALTQLVLQDQGVHPDQAAHPIQRNREQSMRLFYHRQRTSILMQWMQKLFQRFSRTASPSKSVPVAGTLFSSTSTLMDQ